MTSHIYIFFILFFHFYSCPCPCPLLYSLYPSNCNNPSTYVCVQYLQKESCRLFFFVQLSFFLIHVIMHVLSTADYGKFIFHLKRKQFIKYRACHHDHAYFIISYHTFTAKGGAAQRIYLSNFNK